MKTSEFKALIREEIRKVLKETDNQETDNQETIQEFFVPPSPQAIQMLQHLGEFSPSGVVAALVVVYLIFMSGLGVLVFGALGRVARENLSAKLKQFMQDYKDKKQINPAQIKAFHDEIMANVSQLSSGKQKYIKSLISRLERTDLTDKNTLLQMQRKVAHTMRKYQAELNKSK